MATPYEDLTLHETLTARGLTTRPATMGTYAKDILRDGVVVFTGTANDVWNWLKTPDAAPFICLDCGGAVETWGDFGSFVTDCPNCQDADCDGDGYYPTNPQGTGGTEAESVADWNESTLDQLGIRKAAA